MSRKFPHQRVNSSKVIHTVGAILRAGREGDEKVQKSVKMWIAFLTGGGFAVVIALKLLGLLEAQIRQNWKTDDRIVIAISKQTEAIERQSAHMEALVTVIAASREESAKEHAIMLDRKARR